jgi:hypothetical protein
MTTWTQKGNDIEGELRVSSDIFGDFFGNSIQLNGAGNRIVVGAKYHNRTGTDPDNGGQVRVYEFNEYTKDWAQIGQSINGNQNESFNGSSVSINCKGNRIAMSAPFHDGTNTDPSDTGQIRIYEYNEDIKEWEQLGNDIFGESQDSYTFYYGMKLNGLGNRVIIGSAFQQVNTGTLGPSFGSVRVFEYNENTQVWEQIGQSINGEEFNYLGLGVSINYEGDIIVVSIPANITNILTNLSELPGKTRVYKYNDNLNEWIQLGQDISSDHAADFQTEGPFTMIKVDIDYAGYRIIFGDATYDGTSTDPNFNKGYVKIYDYNQNIQEWEQVGQNIEGKTDNDRFSIGVISGNGNRIAVGTNAYPYSDEYYQIYDLVNDTWVLVQEQEGKNGFGFALSLNYDGCVVASSEFITINIPTNEGGIVRIFESNCNNVKIITAENICEYVSILIKYYTQLLAIACTCGPQPSSIIIRNTCINSGIRYDPPQINDNCFWSQNSEDQWIELQCVLKKKLSCFTDQLKRISTI